MNANLYSILDRQPNSFWLSPPDQPSYPALNSDINVDTAIIGGGIAGITTAYLLSMEGYKPTIFEADRIIFGTTGHTTAKITSQHDLIYDKLIATMGNERAQQYALANEGAIAEIRNTIDRLVIDCDFSEQSAFAFTSEEKSITRIQNEVQAAITCGIKATYVEGIPFNIPCKAAARFDGQAQFHPRKYLLALVNEITKNGCTIYEQTSIIDIADHGSGYQLKTFNGRIVTATKVVVTSHFPFVNKPALYSSRLHAERTYILAVKASEPFPGGMYINIEDPPRSLRSQPAAEGELTLVVGENHKTGQTANTAQHYRNLIDFATKHFTVQDIPYHWSAQDCMTLDGLPYAGRYAENTKNLYVATGFGKWGMTNSMASAMLIRDLIVRGYSTWSDVYSPSRLNVVDLVKKATLKGATLPTAPVEKQQLTESVSVNIGEGKSFDIGGHKLGAFRDDSGALHIVDLTCTHMGCEPNWNAAERSWDCPCHGSRYDMDGNVIEGPTFRPLCTNAKFKILEGSIKDDANSLTRTS